MTTNQKSKKRTNCRDRLIIFQTVNEIEDEFGQPVLDDFSDFAKSFAEVIYGKGSERREAGIEGNDLPATFGVLQSPTTRAVTTKHVISFDGAIWDIQGIAPWKRQTIEFTAIRRAA